MLARARPSGLGKKAATKKGKLPDRLIQNTLFSVPSRALQPSPNTHKSLKCAVISAMLAIMMSPMLRNKNSLCILR